MYLAAQIDLKVWVDYVGRVGAPMDLTKLERESASTTVSIWNSDLNFERVGSLDGVFGPAEKSNARVAVAFQETLDRFPNRHVGNETETLFKNGKRRESLLKGARVAGPSSKRAPTAETSARGRRRKRLQISSFFLLKNLAVTLVVALKKKSEEFQLIKSLSSALRFSAKGTFGG